MTAFKTRVALRRSARIVLAGAAMMAAIHGASADDAGIHALFAAVFGGGAPVAEPAPVYAPGPDDVPVYRRLRVYRARPLTVRLHRPKLVAAQGPVKPAKVSILEDRTLRPGDAVMTARGIRVFAGSTSWPYTPGDFVGLDDARHLSKDTSKVLAQLDRLPRG